MFQGRVVKITSDIIEVNFEENKDKIEIGQTLFLHDEKTVLLIDSISNSKIAICIILTQKYSIKINDLVINKNQVLQVPVGAQASGKVFNILGKCLNNKNMTSFQTIPVDSTIKREIEFDQNPTLIETGIKVIDFFLPLVKGNKLGIFGGAGVGKTVIMKELIFNSSKIDESTFSTFIGSGERSREGEELYSELEKANLLKNSTMFISQMNEEPGARMNILPVGITFAEYMRDIEKRNVLLFIDNIYRYIQAGNELSASLGKKPSSAGYQPTLASEVSTIQERLNRTKNGAITSFQTIFLPSDDITDPAAVAIFSHLDGSLVLNREIAASGIYPAFDPLASSSNNISPELIGYKHYEALVEVKSILQKYKELEDLILILGIEDLEESNKIIVRKALQLKNFFSQNFNTASDFTNEPGDFITREDTINSIIQIINGDFLRRSPDDFLYISTTFNFQTDFELEEEIIKNENEVSQNITTKKSKKNKNN